VRFGRLFAAFWRNLLPSSPVQKSELSTLKKEAASMILTVKHISDETNICKEIFYCKTLKSCTEPEPYSDVMLLISLSARRVWPCGS
jgi:hypothetical protein